MLFIVVSGGTQNLKIFKSLFVSTHIMSDQRTSAVFFFKSGTRLFPLTAFLTRTCTCFNNEPKQLPDSFLLGLDTKWLLLHTKVGFESRRGLVLLGCMKMKFCSGNFGLSFVCTSFVVLVPNQEFLFCGEPFSL